MPKVKSSLASKCREYCNEFGQNIFTADQGNLLCRPCNKRVLCDQRGQVLQHLKTKTHKDAVERSKNLPKQTQLTLTTKPGPSVSQFTTDLCEALVSADIPVHKLKNPVFKKFLEKYCQENIPDESTIRKNYLPMMYEKTIDSIRERLAGKGIWISVDETTDITGRCVANVVVGALNGGDQDADDAKRNTFLLHTTFMDQTNYSSISKTINDALQILWPTGIQYDNVFLLVTDAAKYMIKAGQTLQVFYTKMIHLTCLDHGMNRLCETIRESFPAVNTLISSVKKIFVKAPLRKQKFLTSALGIPLPPQPVITRWGTWLSAALYYTENFDAILNVVNSFDADDAISIREAQNVLRSEHLKTDLAYIKANFGFLISTIQKLEGRLSITDSIALVEDASRKINTVPGNIGTTIKNKLATVLDNNRGWDSMCNIAKALSGEHVEIPNALHPNEIAAFRFAPITSCDVERSFSRYKSLLRCNRTSFTTENLQIYFISHCNAFI